MECGFTKNHKKLYAIKWDISAYQNLIKGGFYLLFNRIKNTVDKEYNKLLRHILKRGTIKSDRTGTGTISLFGYQFRIPLSEGFPLLTTKFVSFKLITIELLWFISGDTNIRTLVLQGCNIWNKDGYRGYKDKMKAKYNNQPVLSYDEYIEKIKTDEEFAKEFGDLGDTYGFQWRNKRVDQLKNVIEQIKNNPDSRRLMVVSWDCDVVDSLVLPPCHPLFQFYVENGKLSCHFYMRSNDVFLGLPFNIGSYALLTHLIAQECGLQVGDLIYSVGDTHIYTNHIKQVKQQLKRRPYKLPTLELNPNIKSVFDFTLDDMKIINYKHHPAIKGEMST